MTQTAIESPSMALAKKKVKAGPVSADEKSPIVADEPTQTATTGAKKTVAKAKTGGGGGDDLIISTVKQVENLSKDEAFELIRSLSESVDYSYFRLGGVLSVVQSNGWFHDEGYDNFRAFVETEFGINYRKAMYLVAIYNGLVESGVAWDKVSSLGWSKLKELAHILTPDNVDEWVEAAKNLTVIQLIEHIKEKSAGTLETSGETSTEPTVSSMNFKVHPDQREVIRAALDKAKTEAKTEFDAVALEGICLSFLNSGTAKGGKVAAPVSLESLFKKSTPEEVLGVFEKVWPNVNVTVEQ